MALKAGQSIYSIASPSYAQEEKKIPSYTPPTTSYAPTSAQAASEAAWANYNPYGTISTPGYSPIGSTYGPSEAQYSSWYPSYAASVQPPPAEWLNQQFTGGGVGGESEFPPQNTWPEGYHPVWDSSVISGTGANTKYGAYVWAHDPFTGMSDADRAQLEINQKRLELDTKEANWQMAQGTTGTTPQWRPGELELEQQQLAAQKQYYQWQEDQANKEYMAQLAAKPINWLEYAAYTGQQPVVQPWMLPLMSQEYGFNAGGAIPGWTAENMSNIPSLLNPSAQYLARMGPTAQQQYYGYQQAQQGATPTETQWRLWSMAPPGGQATQLTQAYQHGGAITEPTLLYGLQSRKPYGIAGETAPEYIVPQNQMNPNTGVPPTYETPWGRKGTGFIPPNWRQNPITIPEGNQPMINPNFPVKPNLMGNIPNQPQMIPPWARQPNRLSYAVQ